jgi:LmbE family N-acetylglucosaminyl deacetylase
MVTIVAFHAHPDDECITQAGTLARAVDEGHRVVVVYATRGEHGEFPDGSLAPGERLVDRRTAEAERSAAVLGTARVVWLDYGDSGMIGTPENDDPACFWRADVEEAAGRLADVLREEGAEVLLTYDENGNYGHPDHIQVHRVGLRAAELAGTPQVLEATFNREKVAAMIAAAADAGTPRERLPNVDDDFVLGMPDAVITTRIDVGPWLDRKRASMEAHATQIGDTGPFLAMAPEVFAVALGTEYFIRHGVPAGHRDSELLAR